MTQIQKYEELGFTNDFIFCRIRIYANKVFVNVNGKDDSHISPELKELPAYIRTSKVPEKCVNPLIKDMDEALRKARSNEEWRKDYMTLEMMRNDYTEKGREEEAARYNKLISYLVRDNNYDAFKKMTEDDRYKQELFKHYGL